MHKWKLTKFKNFFRGRSNGKTDEEVENDYDEDDEYYDSSDKKDDDNSVCEDGTVGKRDVIVNSTITCFRCGGHGHKQFQCSTKFQKKKLKRTDSESALLMQLNAFWVVRMTTFIINCVVGCCALIVWTWGVIFF
jgi:hypothetical protein